VVTNRILGVYLRCLAGDRPRQWLQWLPWAEYCYNTSYQTSLQATPFEVVYGRAPPTLAAYRPGLAPVVALDCQLFERDAFLNDVRDRLHQAQDIMKEMADRSCRFVEFAVGDWEWLHLNHRAAAGITFSAAAKLAHKFYGPFQVLERIGDVAYRLQLPASARIHNVFHVVFLKKHVGYPPAAPVPLPPIDHGRAVPTPEKVLRARLNRGVWELSAQWLGLPATDTSWELLESFKLRYPSFQLEDKLFQKEDGSVVDSFVGRKYERRRKKGAGAGTALALQDGAQQPHGSSTSGPSNV